MVGWVVKRYTGESSGLSLLLHLELWILHEIPAQAEQGVHLLVGQEEGVPGRQDEDVLGHAGPHVPRDTLALLLQRLFVGRKKHVRRLVILCSGIFAWCLRYLYHCWHHVWLHSGPRAHLFKARKGTG